MSLNPRLAFVMGAVLLSLAAPLSTAIASQEALCVRRFKQKHFVLAAKCFQRLADAVDGKSSEETRMKAGNWLRNAALAYKQAAAKEKDAQRATYLREKGVQVLKRYIKEKMYRTQTQQRIAKSMLDGLEEKIGYVTLTVLPNNPKAKVQVIGYKFKKELEGGGVVQVRPGKFTVLVVYPDQRRDAKTLDLKPSTPHVLRFGAPKAVKRRVVAVRRTPPLRPKPPAPKSGGGTAGWIIAGIGGAAIAAGVVLVAVSVAVTDTEAATLLSRAKEANDPVLTKEAGDTRSAASAQYIAGWVVLGVGVAALGAGIGLGVAGKKSPPPATAKSAPPTARHTAHTLLRIR